MDLIQLIKHCRVRVNDDVEPYHISDEDWTRYAIHAQYEAAERSLCLFYPYTIPIIAGQSNYYLDPLIITPVRLHLIGVSSPLVQISKRALDRQALGFSSNLDPLFYYQYEHYIVLYPTPRKNDVLEVFAYSYPQSNLSTPDDISLEIEEKDHYFLTHWMCWEALSHFESKTNIKEQAMQEYELFERRFGKPRSTSEIRTWREYPPNMRAVPRSLA